MYRSSTAQALTYTLRLPDEAQGDALRLLETSRRTVNAIIETLWPRLDEFADGEFQAWKHVTRLLPQPHDHGNRQWRCEAETAGRILRSQAERKVAFEIIRPILTAELIRPADGGSPAGKNRPVLMEQVRALRAQAGDDAEKLMTLVNVTEQACNFYLTHERFPNTYEEMQPLPLLKAGLLTYAGDDGPAKGQAYRLRLDIPNQTVWLRLRGPDENEVWNWRAGESAIPLPEAVLERLANGTPLGEAQDRLLAPTLRAVPQVDGRQVACLDFIVEQPVPCPPEWAATRNVLAFDWGVHTLLTVVVLDRQGRQLSRPIYLDSGGFDGRQARLRRQIDELKAKVDRLDPHSPQRARLQQEIALCWAAYSRRNRALAHLAVNFLLTIAALYHCEVMAGEWLASLRTTGRGRGTRGRWRNWRNNTTLRGEIWKVLKYKVRLAGLRLRAEFPRGTSHTCPRCGRPAQTYKSPEHAESVAWGRWLKCVACGWNGSRDYAAALNIGRLVVAFLNQDHSSNSKRGFRVADDELKPVSYIGKGAALPFSPPSSVQDACPFQRGTTELVGWPLAASVHPCHAWVPCGQACSDSTR